MGWLQRTDDEVAVFHPAFEAVANQVLADLNVAGSHEWQHHPGSLGGSTRADFVLVDTIRNHWALIVELKRTPTAVFSARFQSQAKGYADVNQARFEPGRPIYFALSNLEVTELFAVNGTRPPSECVVDGGLWESGDFDLDAAATHTAAYRMHLAELVGRVLKVRTETFEIVWPPIIAEWDRYAQQLARGSPSRPLDPTTAGWAEVNGFFGQGDAVAAGRVTLLQALLAAYMRGRLKAVQHKRASIVPPLSSRGQVARAIEALRTIDFEAIFDVGASARYRAPKAGMRSTIDAYIAALAGNRPDVSTLAETRVDHEKLLEEALEASYPAEARAAAGKVATDPELADVLAALAIDSSKAVVDPCCGDGPLLVAAFDRLTRIGMTRPQALAPLAGVEADPVSCRLAAVRLAMRVGSDLGPSSQPNVVHGDMFASTAVIQAADVVIMNPPFRRYEDQGGSPVPAALLRHFAEAIKRAGGGKPASTLQGQPNLFHYFVEFVTRVVRPKTRIGFILDNKWFHNRTGRGLRQLMLDNYKILALVEYPHQYFFSGWDIATSLVIAERGPSGSLSHQVRFIRTATDPRQADLDILASAMTGGGWPADWSENLVPQASLTAKVGWKTHFAAVRPFDFVQMGLTRLVDLFGRSRRGSLEKEGGGTQAFAMPFTRRDFKNVVARSSHQRGFTTQNVRPLTSAENAQLAAVAAAIPSTFRGRALKVADDVRSYRLTTADVERHQTLEPPALRNAAKRFMVSERVPWSVDHDKALKEIRKHPQAGAFLAAVERIIGLTSAVLPDEKRFVDLREPYAGELVVPRKMRKSHRVHVNPFAFDSSQRQVRLSSNFLTYGECVAVDPISGLDRETATAVIAAFLVSAFGQLQFEENGVNREGMLSLEQVHIDEVLVPDPRSLDPTRRKNIVQAFAQLPFPVMVDQLTSQQPRAQIDRLFAEELAPRIGVSVDVLLQDVHDSVDDWITARQP